MSSVAQVDRCTNNESPKGVESMEVDTEVSSHNDGDRKGDVLEEQKRFLPPNESVDNNTGEPLPKTDEDDPPMDTNDFQSKPKESESIMGEQEAAKQGELSSIGNKGGCTTDNTLLSKTSAKESSVETVPVNPNTDTGSISKDTTDSESEQKSAPEESQKYKECGGTKDDEQENIPSGSDSAKELDSTTNQITEKDPVLTNTTNEMVQENKDERKELQDIAGNEKESQKVASSTEHENKDLKQNQVILTDAEKKSPVIGAEGEKDKYGSTESRNKMEISKSSQIKEKETEKKKESGKIVDKSHSKDPSKSLSGEKFKSGSSDRTSGSSKSSSSSSSSRHSSSSKTSSSQKHDKVSSGKSS